MYKGVAVNRPFFLLFISVADGIGFSLDFITFFASKFAALYENNKQKSYAFLALVSFPT